MNNRYSYSRLQSTARPSARVYQEDVTDSPVDMCLFSDVNKSLVGGVLGARYGPGNENCQLFMADRCSRNWDAVCDVAAMNQQARFANNATIRGNAAAAPGEIVGGSTIGSQLVHNAGQRRFCKFNNTNIQQFPFDPTNYSSPTITRILRSEFGNNPVCTVNPATIDKDTLMNRMLDDPATSQITLDNICLNMRGRLGNTRIGQYCAMRNNHNQSGYMKQKY